MNNNLFIFEVKSLVFPQIGFPQNDYQESNDFKVETHSRERTLNELLISNCISEFSPILYDLILNQLEVYCLYTWGP